MLVEDLMSTDLESISPDMPLHAALKKMNAAGYRHLPVVEADKLVGIVTDRDLRLAVNSPIVNEEAGLNREKVLDDILVSECMTPDPQSVTSRTSARDAAELLILSKFGAMPVVDDGALVGMISYIDFLKHFVSSR